MRNLEQIYADHLLARDYGDKGSAHTYIKEYNKLFAPYRFNSTILEIGVCQGHSMVMWTEYFHNSTILGVDIGDPIFFRENDFVVPNGNTLSIYKQDATTNEFADTVSTYSFDLIIDDASHQLEDQLTTFDLLFDKLKPNGLYIIEDILDIDANIEKFKNLYNNVDIIDNRHINNRWDDVLVIIRK